VESNDIVARFDRVFKTRGSHRALDGLDFKILKGEIACLLGPNGAGKSTTLQLLLGVIKPDAGHVEVFGIAPDSISAKTRIGCTPQETGFLDHLKVQETLSLVAAHYPRPRKINEMLENFGLAQVRNRQTHALSGGQRRCLALACAFVGSPDFVILDEPTTGLDVDIRRRLWSEIRNFANAGGSVLFSTHYLGEAEELASRVLVMNSGRLIAEGKPDLIKSELALKEVEFHCESDVAIPLQTRFTREGARFRVWTSHADDFVKELSRNYDFRDLEVRSVSLEEAFIMLLEKQ
jgi:ABC-2 type transport system ATP-binding protein